VLRCCSDRTMNHFWNELLLEIRNRSLTSNSVIESSGLILAKNHYQRQKQTYTQRRQCCASGGIWRVSSISSS
jgi:hypothetical protein